MIRDDEDECATDLGPDYLLLRDNAEAYKNRLVRQLERLGAGGLLVAAPALEPRVLAGEVPRRNGHPLPVWLQRLLRLLGTLYQPGETRSEC